MRSNREEITLDWVKEILALSGITATGTTEQYTKHDLDCSNGGIIEVKERWLDKTKFKEYSEKGFILEDIKYQYLLGKKSLYCNVFDFSDIKVALFWNVNQIESNIRSLGCKATTSFENNNYISKQVHLVNINQTAFIYLYENGEWIRSNKENLITKLN